MEAPIKKRNPYLAAFLNLILCGMGHIYVGMPARFFVVFSVYLLGGWILAISNAMDTSFYWLVFGVICAVAFYVFIITDAFLTARRNKDYTLKSYNKWYIYVLHILFLIGVSFLNGEIVERNIGSTTYKTMTENMVPLINPGEVVVCNKKAYAGGHLPAINDIVAANIQGINVIRTIDIIDSNGVGLKASNPSAPSPVIVPDRIAADEIICKVEYIARSPEWGRLGIRFNK